MCEETMPYSVGTLLWFKTPIKIWWPAKVIDASTMPEDLHDYREKNKDNTLAVVKFMTENKYECVTNMEKVCLYSSPKKMDFIEKGYSKYLQQKNGTECKFNMEYFIEDVKHFEREIGGNQNIFTVVEKNITYQKTNSTELNQLMSTLTITSTQTKQKKSKTAKPLKNDVDNIIEDGSDHSDNVKPGSEDIKILSEQKDTLNEIFDIDENEFVKVFGRLQVNNSHNNHVDEDKSREIDESKEFIKKDPEYVNEIVSFSDNSSVLNSSDGNAVKKDITVADQSIQFTKESVNLNKNNHIKTENVESCIKSSTSTETKYSPCPSTVKTKTKKKPKQNDQKANRLVNNITDGEECMFGKTIPTDEWVKHNPWVAFENNGMDEARKYASKIMNMSMMSLESHVLKPMMEEEPPFKAPIFCGAPYDENPNSYELFQAPKVPPKYTDEELVNLPEFKLIRELLDSGQEDALTVTINGAKRIHNPWDYPE